MVAEILFIIFFGLGFLVAAKNDKKIAANVATASFGFALEAELPKNN